jgi:hypothetical protein
MGKISIPEMRRFGYDKRIAAGSVASGGTLGILIPPVFFSPLWCDDRHVDRETSHRRISPGLLSGDVHDFRDDQGLSIPG